MDLSAILALYDAEMRRDPPVQTDLRHSHIGGLVRSEGSFYCIAYSDFPLGAMETRVAEKIAFFSGSGRRLEWKLYGHDAMPGLAALLERSGFEADER